MPLYYGFNDRQTGKVVPLQVVDDRLREQFGLPPDADDYCPHLDALVNAGRCLKRTGALPTEPSYLKLLNLAQLEELLLHKYDFFAYSTR